MSIESFNEKVKKMVDTIQDLHAGLTLLNADIEEMRNSEKQNLEKIEDLQDQDVYRMYTVEDRIYACLVFQKQIIVLRTQVMRYTGFLSVT